MPPRTRRTESHSANRKASPEWPLRPAPFPALLNRLQRRPINIGRVGILFHPAREKADPAALARWRSRRSRAAGSRLRRHPRLRPKSHFSTNNVSSTLRASGPSLSSDQPASSRRYVPHGRKSVATGTPHRMTELTMLPRFRFPWRTLPARLRWPPPVRRSSRMIPLPAATDSSSGRQTRYR